MRGGALPPHHRQMRMLYQYVLVEQIHSVSQCPGRWSYPLNLLFKLANFDIQNDLVIMIDQSILQSGKMVNEIIKGKEYKIPLPSHPENKLEESQPGIDISGA
jgi:hypothetical protein